jgi:ubiquilin
VADLKVKVAEKLEVPVEAQRLIFKGRILKDDQTLEECKIVDGVIVHMVKGKTTAAAPA